MEDFDSKVNKLLQGFFSVSPDIISCGIIRVDGRFSFFEGGKLKEKNLQDLLTNLNFIYSVVSNLFKKGTKWLFLEGEKRCLILERLLFANYLLLFTKRDVNIGLITVYGRKIKQELKDCLLLERDFIVFKHIAYCFNEIFCKAVRDVPEVRDEIFEFAVAEDLRLINFLQFGKEGIVLESLSKALCSLEEKDRIKIILEEMTGLIGVIPRFLKKRIEKKRFREDYLGILVSGYLALKALIELYNIQVGDYNIVDTKVLW
jgi:hypothetical protein